MMDGNWIWGFMGFAWLFWLVVLGVIAWAVVMVVKNSQRQNEQTGTLDKPVEILKRRYARGEISREEFEQMKKDLES